jgi:hypothetical protein
LGSVIVVFKPHDVVLAQVVTRLHLDDLQRDAAGVGQAVHLVCGDIVGLIFSKFQHIVTVGDFGSVGRSARVFSTIVVFLQAAACFGFVLDALDFEEAAFFETVVPGPRALHFVVLDGIRLVCTAKSGGCALLFQERLAGSSLR